MQVIEKAEADAQAEGIWSAIVAPTPVSLLRCRLVV